MEDSHYRHALDELDVLVSLEGELVYLDEALVYLDKELVDAHVFGKFFLELHREVLLDVVELVGLGRQWLDSHRVELVAPQVLERHGVVVLDVEPRHLVHFGVDARVLPLHVGVVVAVLELAQRLLWLDVVDVLASRCLEVD